MATNRNDRKYELPQTETVADRNGHKPKRLQTENATNRNDREPEQPHHMIP